MMKVANKFLLFILTIFLSTNLVAQDTRMAEELQSANDAKIRAEKNVLDPALTEGLGILLVEDFYVHLADSVESMLIASSIPYTRIQNTQFVDTTVTAWLGYDAAIWVGTTSAGAELDSTTAYLAAGGNLIVWENDEAYFFGGRTGAPSDLFALYFQALYVSDDGSDGIITGVDVMAGIMMDISADPYPDDVVLTGPNATGLFLAPGDTTFAALRAGDGSYRAGLMLWDPEFGPVDSNMAVLQRIVDYVAYGIVPVELTSFSANAHGNNVSLNWTTATETNNRGFEIQRRTPGNQFDVVAFVEGSGTTTEAKAYTFVDNDLNAGTYIYRLKQIDFNGTSEYSSEVNVEVTGPAEYSLHQNYPNPFNPNTSIKYSVEKDGLVNLSVYNLVGEKVATIVNSNMEAGTHEVTFDASSLPSGVYIYKLQAGDFVNSKKMILLK